MNAPPPPPPLLPVCAAASESITRGPAGEVEVAAAEPPSGDEVEVDPRGPSGDGAETKVEVRWTPLGGVAATPLYSAFSRVEVEAAVGPPTALPFSAAVALEVELAVSPTSLAI